MNVNIYVGTHLLLCEKCSRDTIFRLVERECLQIHENDEVQFLVKYTCMRAVEIIFDRSAVVLVCKLEHILVAISVVE